MYIGPWQEFRLGQLIAAHTKALTKAVVEAERTGKPVPAEYNQYLSGSPDLIGRSSPTMKNSQSDRELHVVNDRVSLGALERKPPPRKNLQQRKRRQPKSGPRAHHERIANMKRMYGLNGEGKQGDDEGDDGDSTYVTTAREGSDREEGEEQYSRPPSLNVDIPSNDFDHTGNMGHGSPSNKRYQMTPTTIEPRRTSYFNTMLSKNGNSPTISGSGKHKKKTQTIGARSPYRAPNIYSPSASFSGSLNFDTTNSDLSNVLGHRRSGPYQHEYTNNLHKRSAVSPMAIEPHRDHAPGRNRTRHMGNTYSEWDDQEPSVRETGSAVNVSSSWVEEEGGGSGRNEPRPGTGSSQGGHGRKPMQRIRTPALSPPSSPPFRLQDVGLPGSPTHNNRNSGGFDGGSGRKHPHESAQTEEWEDEIDDLLKWSTNI